MTEQALAGWYPDGSGNERYWEGSAWTEHIRRPGGVETIAVGTQAKKEGAFARVGTAVKKAAADKQLAKDERILKQSDDALAAGALVTSGIFGTSTVEIYDGGYVRIAAGLDNATQPALITKNTPYEKLRSIKFTQPRQERTSGRASTLEGAVGTALAGLMKGGAGLMKASAPGLAVAGLAHLAGAEDRKSFLTVVTDREIRTLSNQSSNGFINKVNKGHNEVGLALEAAGNSLFSLRGVESREPVPRLQTARKSQPADAVTVNSTVGGRFRELADLHTEGILSDDEFATAKAKLLSGL